MTWNILKIALTLDDFLYIMYVSDFSKRLHSVTLYIIGALPLVYLD